MVKQEQDNYNHTKISDNEKNNIRSFNNDILIYGDGINQYYFKDIGYSDINTKLWMELMQIKDETISNYFRFNEIKKLDKLDDYIYNAIMKILEIKIKNNDQLLFSNFDEIITTIEILNKNIKTNCLKEDEQMIYNQILTNTAILLIPFAKLFAGIYNTIILSVNKFFIKWFDTQNIDYKNFIQYLMKLIQDKMHWWQLEAPNLLLPADNIYTTNYFLPIIKNNFEKYWNRERIQNNIHYLHGRILITKESIDKIKKSELLNKIKSDLQHNNNKAWTKIWNNTEKDLKKKWGFESNNIIQDDTFDLSKKNPTIFATKSNYKFLIRFLLNLAKDNNISKKTFSLEEIKQMRKNFSYIAKENNNNSNNSIYINDFIKQEWIDDIPSNGICPCKNEIKYKITIRIVGLSLKGDELLYLTVLNFLNQENLKCHIKQIIIYTNCDNLVNNENEKEKFEKFIKKYGFFYLPSYDKKIIIKPYQDFYKEIEKVNRDSIINEKNFVDTKLAKHFFSWQNPY